MAAELDEFMAEYERATNSHDIARLDPFIADDAVYWFTDGEHVGKQKVLDAIQRTFDTIEGEVYEIVDLEWIVTDQDAAVCRYRFVWTGIIDGRAKSGSGHGTSVLARIDGTWQVRHEHLSD